MQQDNIPETEIVRSDANCAIKLSQDSKSLLKYFERIVLFAEKYSSESSRAAIEDMMEQAIDQYLYQCRWLTIGVTDMDKENDLIAITITNHDCKTCKALVVEMTLNPLSFVIVEDIDELKIPF